MIDKKQPAMSSETALILHELGKITGQLTSLEKHTCEWRDAQSKTNHAIFRKLDEHDERIRYNETSIAKRAGIISAATGVGVALIAEAVKLAVKANGS